MNKSCFIFDMNGTMIDDMAFHTKVWQTLLNDDLGGNLTYEEVKVQMYGKNGDVLERVFGKNRFTPEEIDHLSIKKEKRYQEIYLPHLKLIDGLEALLKKAHQQGIKMGIGSAAIPFNINFILDNLLLHNYFEAVVSADDVVQSKPHPETFLRVAELLGKMPEDCIVFEDAPKGVEAAQSAGMQSIVLLTAHEPEDFKKYNNIIGMIRDYNDPVIAQLL